MATIDDFQKLDIRVGEVLEASAVEGSEKLLKLVVDFGVEKRQILSGIAKHYSPEDIAGKKFVFLFNIEPRAMMGMESSGMILAASDGENIALVSPVKDLKPGAKLS